MYMHMHGCYDQYNLFHMYMYTCRMADPLDQNRSIFKELAKEYVYSFDADSSVCKFILKSLYMYMYMCMRHTLF